MMFIKEERRYPEEGDKFFIEDGEGHEVAWLNKAFQRFGGYASSYELGALSLIDTALSDQTLRDFQVYPAIFLIRHYIELRLKELIQGLNYCNSQTNEFPTHHDIKLMWEEFKKKYVSIGESINDPRFKVINDLMHEMDSVDPISMAFRYPIDKKGNEIQKLEYVNLVNLRETFVRMCFVFDGVAMQISHYVGITEEMMNPVYENYWE